MQWLPSEFHTEPKPDKDSKGEEPPDEDASTDTSPRPKTCGVTDEDTDE